MSRFKHYNKKSGTTTTVPASLDLAFISDTREILTHGETYGGYIGNNNVINLGGSSLTPVKLDISVNGSTVVNHDTFGNASKVNLLNGDMITLSTTIVDQIPRVTIGHNSVLTQATDFTRTTGQVVKKISVTKEGHISAIEFEDITLSDIPTHAALTITSAGGGDISGTTFDGSVAKTISYNSIGAAPLNSAAFTGTPTTPNPAADAADGQIANVKYVKDSITNHFASSGAMKWMGTTNLTYFNNTITKQAGINTGMAWKITEAGTYAGQTCEIGDVIIAIADQPGTTASNYLIIQKNVDLATRTFTDGTITSQTPGIVNVGTNINLVNGNISVNTANGSTLGLVKEGTGTSISSGTISVTSAPKLQNTTAIGDTNSPIYFTNGGVPTAITTTSVTHGGTGLDTLTSGKVLIGNGTGAVTFKDPKVTIAGVDVELGGSLTLDQIGLSGAMHFLGVSSTTITNGGTEKPTINSTVYNLLNSGDVVINGTLEYVWDGSKWCLLGQDGSFKVVQTAVSSPSTSGSTTAFIDTISQNTNGVITATKKNLDTTGTWSGNAGSATKLANARTLWGKSFDGSANVEGDIKVSGISTFSSPSATTYGSGTNGQVLMSNGSSTYWGTINIPEEDSDSYITYTRYSFVQTNGKYLEASLKEAVSIPTRMTLDLKVKGFRASAIVGPQIIRGFDDEVDSRLGKIGASIHVYGGIADNSKIFCTYEKKSVSTSNNSYGIYLSSNSSIASTTSTNGIHLVHHMDKNTTSYDVSYSLLTNPSTTYSIGKWDSTNNYQNESVKRFIFNTLSGAPFEDSGINLTYVDEILLINTDTNEILMQLVPVKRSTDDKCGFYDIISKSTLIDESGTWSVTGATAMGQVHKELIMSTDADTVDGFHIKQTSLSAYTSLSTKDSNTLYIITS